MDEFNQNNNFDEDNDNNIGEISGFDDNTDNTPKVDDEGYYTRSHSDIIQDYEEASREDAKNNFGSSFNSYYDNMQIPKKHKKEKRYGAGVVLIASVLAAIIGFGGSFLTFRIKDKTVYVNPDSLPKVSSSTSETTQKNDTVNIDSTAASIAQQVALKCSKSVVGIRTTTSVISFFGGTSESTGEGSGVVYTADGYIITNYHVIENAVTSSNASKIEVFFDNMNTKGYSASVIGYNISADLAVLKVNAANLKKVEIGNSDGLSVGQYAITIGAPGGLEFMGSVTYGIISGLNRVVSSNSKIGLIQTDAAINPGNSGGALLDENGKLIGINSSKIVSEEFEGMGFAIPVNTVVEICNNIITNKDNKEPYVGITISDKYTANVLKMYNYPVGAVVLSVTKGSTAESCGIKKGDIITEFNGVEITEYDMFEKTLKKCSPDTAVPITIYRSGRYYQAKITIGSNS